MQKEFIVAKAVTFKQIPTNEKHITLHCIQAGAWNHPAHMHTCREGLRVPTSWFCLEWSGLSLTFGPARMLL